VVIYLTNLEPNTEWYSTCSSFNIWKHCRG